LRRAQQHSSVLSGSEPRPSVDTQRSVIDEAARLRSRKRREKLEEFIRTEESYVADLKALSNVCALVTVLVDSMLILCRPTVHYSVTSLQLGQRVLPDAQHNMRSATYYIYMTDFWASFTESCLLPNTTRASPNHRKPRVFMLDGVVSTPSRRCLASIRCSPPYAKDVDRSISVVLQTRSRQSCNAILASSLLWLQSSRNT